MRPWDPHSAVSFDPDAWTRREQRRDLLTIASVVALAAGLVVLALVFVLHAN